MTSTSTPLPNPGELTSPSKVLKSPVYYSPSLCKKVSQPGPVTGDTPEYLCPPISAPLRRYEQNIPSDSPTKPNSTPQASPLSSQPTLPAIPPVPGMKRTHPDTDPVPLSPQSRKRRLALDSGEITTRPTSTSRHGMCLRNSRKSPLVQEPTTPKSPPIQEL